MEALRHRNLRDAVFDSLWYWETMRIPYNLVLILVVAFYSVVLAFCGYGFALTMALQWFAVQFFLILLAANALYCAVYIIDVPLEMGESRTGLGVVRTSLFLVALFGSAAVVAFAFSYYVLWDTLLFGGFGTGF